MADGDKPSGLAGVGIDSLDDDPFNIDVTVTLDGLAGAKGAKTDDKSGDQDDGKGRRDHKDDDEKDGAKARSDDAEDDEEEDTGEDRGRLRASRRNAKRLRRAVYRQGAELAVTQTQLAEAQGMIVNLVKGNLDERLQAAKSRLDQMRSVRANAREKDDNATEIQAEDEIGKLTTLIGQLEGNVAEVGKFKAPVAGNAMLSTWMEENSDWYQKPGFEAETAAAQAASKRIAASGVGAGDPRHYEAIDKDVRGLLAKKKIVDTELDDADDDDDRGQRGKGKDRDEPMRGPAAGGNRQRGGGRQGGPAVPRAMVDAFRARGFEVEKPEVQKMMWDRYQETQRNLKARAG